MGGRIRGITVYGDDLMTYMRQARIWIGLDWYEFCVPDGHWV